MKAIKRIIALVVGSASCTALCPKAAAAQDIAEVPSATVSEAELSLSIAGDLSVLQDINKIYHL